MRRLLLAGLASFAASAGAAEVRAVAAASVTRTASGEGRLDLVFVNQSSVPLGFTVHSLKATPEASASCRAEALRLENSPSRTSIKLMGKRYVSDTPPRGWAHRQLQVPASLMDIGCTLRLLANAISDESGPQTIEPALIIPLRTGYWTPLDWPLAQGPAPTAAAYSEFNLKDRLHVVHVLYRFNENGNGPHEIAADANATCGNRGPQITLSLPDSDRKLHDQRVLIRPGQWSGLLLWAKPTLVVDGCSVTTKLMRQRPAAEVTVKQELTRQSEFVPDGPIP